MIICPYCERNNPDGRVICQNCGRHFSLLDAGVPTLALRDSSLDIPDMEPMVAERSGYFPVDAAVVMQVEGSKIPLVVQIPSMAVLGRTSSDRATHPQVDLGAFGAHHRGVSARHAAFQRDNEQLLLRDLGSTNGTFLNGRKLAPYQTEVLCSGDELHLGQLQMCIFFEIQVERPN